MDKVGLSQYCRASMEYRTSFERDVQLQC
uniref:Uncharacterized protein n=1 Tax=Arundo donax TaxID=35708 RepID=A0A0A9BDA7_ARUDO